MSDSIVFQIRERLNELQDLKYKEFQSRLIPTVDPDTVIGVRTPELRKLAKELSDIEGIEVFTGDVPHKYYEENILHGLIIEKCRDFGRLVQLLDEFLPYVDNWAVCDILSPKLFKKYPEEAMNEIRRWIDDDAPYTKRFGIEMLMSFYLDDNFKAEYLELVSAIRSDEYYVNMMIAWFFATALAKQWDSAVTYIEEGRMDDWTHNKTIQKAVESYRITDEQKSYLRTFKKRGFQK
ncbi:MAG: DNA alkylation repair protein [Emergencia sp.]